MWNEDLVQGWDELDAEGVFRYCVDDGRVLVGMNQVLLRHSALKLNQGDDIWEEVSFLHLDGKVDLLQDRFVAEGIPNLQRHQTQL